MAHKNSWFAYSKKWWFSIAMLVYQRVLYCFLYNSTNNSRTCYIVLYSLVIKQYYQFDCTTSYIVWQSEYNRHHPYLWHPGRGGSSTRATFLGVTLRAWGILGSGRALTHGLSIQKWWFNGIQWIYIYIYRFTANQLYLYNIKSSRLPRIFNSPQKPWWI